MPTKPSKTTSTSEGLPDNTASSWEPERLYGVLVQCVWPEQLAKSCSVILILKNCFCSNRVKRLKQCTPFYHRKTSMCPRSPFRYPRDSTRFSLGTIAVSAQARAPLVRRIVDDLRHRARCSIVNSSPVASDRHELNTSLAVTSFLRHSRSQS